MVRGEAAEDAVERLAEAFGHVQRFIDAGEMDGAALAVAVGGEIVAEWYGGNAATDRPSRQDTLWPLASISKLYTAAAVLALVERGVLTLSTPVRAVLPEFDGDGRERVTLQHLLTHTSGVIYESPRMEQLLREQTPLDAIVDELYRSPLLFAPGRQHSYSDLGFALAGRVASIAAGLPFPELVRRYVLEPAQLRDTFMPPPAMEYGRLAYVTGGFAEGSGGAMYNAPYALDLAHPAFGTVASARDLARFGLLFRPNSGDRILSGATVRAMSSDQLAGAVRPADPDAGSQPPCWGLGFMVRAAGDHGGTFGLLPPGSFGHGGASGCSLAIDPVDDLVIAFVSNRHANTGRERFTYRIASTINLVLAAMTR